MLYRIIDEGVVILRGGEQLWALDLESGDTQ